jgi:hypothetical protein
VLVTNTDYEILTLSHLYRDAENAFDELNGTAAGNRPPSWPAASS